jgi:TPR repeat protein
LKGYAASMSKVASFYLTGVVVLKDPLESHHYYSMAAAKVYLFYVFLM